MMMIVDLQRRKPISNPLVSPQIESAVSQLQLNVIIMMMMMICMITLEMLILFMMMKMVVVLF